MNENNKDNSDKVNLVYYRKDRVYLFFFLGLLHLLVYAYPHDFSLIHLPIPFLLFGFAVSSYRKVALNFSKGVLRHKAIFGPSLKSYRYENLSDFRIEGQSLYLLKKDRMVKICAIWLLDKKGLSLVIEA
jgi:hypothetical protein